MGEGFTGAGRFSKRRYFEVTDATKERRATACRCEVGGNLEIWESPGMKTTLEIPDDLYQQAKVHAARENRKIDDLVADGLRLLLGQTAPGKPRRMTKAAVRIREGNSIRPLTNDQTARLLTRAGERLP